MVSKMVFLCLGLVACISNEQASIQTIDADQLKELSSGDVVLLDVRTPREVAAGRIPGAVAIDFRNQNFEAEVSKLDVSKELIVYCAVGGRSTASIKTLKDAGFTTIYNYKGGFKDWKARGEEIHK